MNVVEKKLKKRNIKYIKRTVEEGRESIDQLFFHDPDGFMIEVCNCEKLTWFLCVLVEPVSGFLLIGTTLLLQLKLKMESKMGNFPIII